MMSPATQEYISKFPVDKRGYHVLPCISLLPDNMQKWMEGLRVTIGLSDAGTSTNQGQLIGWNDDHMIIEVGGKKKKLPYDPTDIQLCVFQFDIGVTFNGMDRENSAGMGLSVPESAENVLQNQKDDCEEQEKEVRCVKEQEVPNESNYKPQYAIKRE